MEIPIAIIALAGWLVWTIAEIVIEQMAKENDGDEKTVFSLGDYASRHKFIWLGSLLCIPIILWAGQRQLNIDPLGSLTGAGVSAWHDVYIVASGAVFEVFVFAVKKVKSVLKKKEAEL